jgi:acyl transferase domain-containing protein/NAD(P)-dependent dehydrogenase (short-subunit alcohol dehydrogenase family)/acyl-CoA thioesterase FadM
MGVFAWPYRVLFQDTMAYGWHHFLTNFKFQCEAREQLLFNHWMTTPEGRAESEDLVLLTHEGYTRNLAPVALGDTVGVLLSHEEASPSAVRVCFRVVRSDGTPVCCGFQTVVSSTRAGAIVPASPATRRFGLAFREKLTLPSFSERVLSGIGLDRIFDEETIRLGKATAASPAGAGKLPPSFGRVVTEDALVFAFPGAGSITPTLLAELAAVDFLGAGSLVQRAEEVTQDVLGGSLRPLVENREPLDHLRRNPGLAQVVIYLANVIPALWLQERGARPDILVGHSLGEIAALAIGGACSLETGLAAVAHRAHALRHAVAAGGMLILFVHAKRARSLLEVLGRTSLEIAVVNLPEQTVVSGSDADLERLAALAAHTGTACTRLESPFPFHSRLLTPCVAPFADALRALPLHVPERAVFSPMERDFYSSEDDLPGRLASHFVRPLAFDEALRDLHELGARRFVECGGGRALTGLVPKALEGRPVRAQATLHGDARAALRLALEVCGVRAPLEAPAAAPPVPAERSRAAVAHAPAEVTGPLPIAVVGVGCVLPEAHDPSQLWENVLGARVSISDEPPHDARDFSSEGEVPVPDKTYSRLGGWVRGFVPDRALGAFPTDAQRLLATALAQCLAGTHPDPSRTHLLVGSTADGCREYEQALLLAGLHALVRESVSDPAEAERFERALEAALGRHPALGPDLSPWPLFRAVADRAIGEGAHVLAFDAACASSLYAIAAGMRSLRRGECDLALAGGVFTPGAPNASLFAQFRGLSAKGSRPFDSAADGVVFSEGAGLLALKRLPDALAAKDKVYAVLRGFACSSDGKSPSVMEPREAGQLLAVRRAYTAANVDPATVQFLEAHATATPVGDAVEVKAAAQLLQGSGEAVALGSVKANIGHTGWAAGVASVLKVVGAFSARTIPPQAGFAEPSARLELERSHFFIPTRPLPWPENRRGEPRRAGVNGFGFGGSNAHLVLEEFEPAYHAALAAQPREPQSADGVAVVAHQLVRPADGMRFTAEELALPDGVRILPDVVDHMARGQLLAIQAAHRALGSLPGWEKLAEETGVILGVEGKTGRGIDATLRVFRDHVARRLREDGARDAADFIVTRLDRLPASGPYTLLGLMPNVIAGRISNAFNLKGANLVVDGQRASLLEAIELGRRWVEGGECKVVLAGAIHGHAHPAIAALVHGSRAFPEARPLAEAAVVLALAPVALAREKGWNVIAVLGGRPAAKRLDVGRERVCLLGAEGALEVGAALEAAARGQGVSVAWPRGGELVFAPARAAADPAVAGAAAGTSPIEVPLADEPLVAATIALVETPASPGHDFALRGRHVLVAVDRPDWCRSEAARQLLAGVEHRFVVPAGSGVAGAIELDLASEDSLARSLAGLEGFDAIVACADVGGEDVSTVERRPLLELVFALARHAYDRIASGEVVLGALVRGAGRPGGQLHPLTGLLAGFAKSLARELPQARIKVVSTDDADIGVARGRLEGELGTAGGPVELVFRGGRRLAFQLLRTDDVAIGEAPDPDVVVVATGGARGVTAVLVEAALHRGGTAVLLGRSDPASVPADLVALSDEAFAAREPAFYASELERGGRLLELRARWRAWTAAREVAQNLARLAALPGVRISYRRCDVLDCAQVEAAISDIAREHGRIDLVIHGAGIQTSKLLHRRTLAELRMIVATKLDGLANLRSACALHLPGARPHFHVVSSVAGFAGNPGQADYAAANDALVRLAACRGATAGEGEWSAIAWPGWDGIGMARGSEYAAIAAATGQRWLSREEGKSFFARVLAGRPAQAAVAPVRESDLIPLGLSLRAAPGRLAAAVRCHLSVETHPFLAQHTVGGVPTAPGAFLLEIAAQAALSLRPGRRVVRFEHATFDRFVKVPSRGATLGVLLRVVAEDDGETMLQVKVVSDFVHPSGAVLQRGIEHARGFVVLAARGASLGEPRRADSTVAGIELADPYQSAHSPVRLTGPFGALDRLVCRPLTTSALFRSREQPPVFADAVLPVLQLDALFRVAGTCSLGDDVPISVPVACGVLELSDRPTHDPAFLIGATPRFEGSTVLMDWGEAHAPDGRLLLRFSNGVGRRVGSVPRDTAAHAGEEIWR